MLEITKSNKIDAFFSLQLDQIFQLRCSGGDTQYRTNRAELAAMAGSEIAHSIQYFSGQLTGWLDVVYNSHIFNQAQASLKVF